MKTSGNSDPKPGAIPSRAAQAPTIVKVAFWMSAGGATLILVSMVLILASRSRIIEEVIKANKDASRTPDTISSDVTTQIWVLLAMSALFAFFMAFFAMKVRNGERKARTRLAVMTVLALLFAFFIAPTQYSLIGLIGLVALALLFTRPATEFLTTEQ